MSSSFGGLETEVQLGSLCVAFVLQALPCLGGLTGRPHTVLTIHVNTCIRMNTCEYMYSHAFPLPLLRDLWCEKGKGASGWALWELS